MITRSATALTRPNIVIAAIPDSGDDETVTDRVSLPEALDDIAAIGPFFVASANPAEEVDPSWRPARELYTEPAALDARLRQVANALNTDEPRIAASIAHQGLVARLVSPLIAVASVHGLVPSWSPDSLCWRFAAVGAWPLWESDPSAARPSATALPAAVAGALAGPHLVALEHAVRARASVSARTLRGNAASAVVAAGRLVARSRPGSAETAYAVVRELLAGEPLLGAGTFGVGWGFRRRSCCLYYRVPGGGTCGDCVLTGRSTGGR